MMTLEHGSRSLSDGVVSRHAKALVHHVSIPKLRADVSEDEILVCIQKMTGVI